MTEQTPWPADQVEHWPISRLTPYARNARTHSDEQIAQIAASIKEWGWTNPILVDEGGGIIAGHGRLVAAQRMGVEAVPVMVARGWSRAQKQAYILADNQLALNAGWNDELLKFELSDLSDLGFDLSLTGFAEHEIAALTAAGNPGLTDPDEAPEPPETPVSMLGDVWVLGRHRLVCGDSTDADTVARALNGVTPHLMVTDPPYGVNYNPAWRDDAVKIEFAAKRATGIVANDRKADWRDAWALFPGEVAYIWHASMFGSAVADSLGSVGFQLRSQIVWVKQHFILGQGDYHWQHEPCWYAVRKGKNGHYVGGRSQSTVWQIKTQIGFESSRKGNIDKASGHGTQKPVECMKRPIENNSSPGQAVYEPFSGSGTTIIAAEMTGRACHAIELNPTYVDVAVKRWQAFAGQQATLEGEERSFDEIAAKRQAEAA